MRCSNGLMDLLTSNVTSRRRYESKRTKNGNIKILIIRSSCMVVSNVIRVSIRDMEEACTLACSQCGAVNNLLREGSK
jgi:hypothetical protein